MLLYEFSDYKGYLLDKTGHAKQRSGVKSALATAMRCQTTYLSRILHGNSHLSLEQAEAINEFFHHSREESHYFLLLVQRERAGTAKLKRYFQEQLDELLSRRLSLKDRIAGDHVLDRTDQAEYYSSWHYAALHVAITVPKLRTREALSRYFQIPVPRVVSVLEFLIRVNLAKIEKGEYRPTQTLLMLGSDSPNIIRHHSNWRSRAINSLDTARSEDIHYSAVVSVARSDLPLIREKILRLIEENLVVIKKSKEEEVLCCCIDLFGLGG